MAKHASGRHEFESECVKVTVNPAARLGPHRSLACSCRGHAKGRRCDRRHGAEPPESSFQRYPAHTHARALFMEKSPKFSPVGGFLGDRCRRCHGYTAPCRWRIHSHPGRHQQHGGGAGNTVMGHSQIWRYLINPGHETDAWALSSGRDTTAAANCNVDSGETRETEKPKTGRVRPFEGRHQRARSSWPRPGQDLSNSGN